MSKIKNFFSFTRHEQYGIILLVVLILITMVINFFIREKPPAPLDETTLAQWEQEVRSFQEAQEAAIQYSDSIRLARQQRKMLDQGDRYSEQLYPKYQKKEKKLPPPFPFDPNKIDTEDFIRLGFSEKQAESIVKYRSKGAVFKNKSDFQKVFVVSDEMFDRLEPYILLPDSEISTQNEAIAIVENSDEEIVLELNTADTTDLKKVKYIGSTLAKRIDEHRRRLGGFYSVQQLLDINGITEERFSVISAHFTVDARKIKKLDLNKSTFKEFTQHPYFEYYIVKTIFEYKDKNGTFLSVDDIRNISLIYDDLYNRLSPYLYVSSK